MNANNTRQAKDRSAEQSGGKGPRCSWKQYKKFLADSFERMTPGQRERLVRKNCIALSMGAGVSGLTMIYRALPLMLRIISVPAVLAFSFIIGNELVSPMMIRKFKPSLMGKTKSRTQENYSEV